MLLCQIYLETKTTLNHKSYVSKLRWINTFVNKGVKVRGLVAEAPQTGFIPDIQISKLTKYFLKTDFQNNFFDIFGNKIAFSSALSLKKYQNWVKYSFLKSLFPK